MNAHLTRGCGTGAFLEAQPGKAGIRVEASIEEGPNDFDEALHETGPSNSCNTNPGALHG